MRNREKAAKWADQGVELVDGDWNDAAAISAALKGVEGAFVMLPAVWAPSPDYREAKDVIANYVEALSKVVPPRVVALSSMGANRISGVGMITLDDARETIESWRIDYNQVRPHSALGYLTPEEFATGYANEESKNRFLHSHILDGGCGPSLQLNSNPSALTYTD